MALLALSPAERCCTPYQRRGLPARFNQLYTR
jgi:hypothetical protein